MSIHNGHAPTSLEAAQALLRRGIMPHPVRYGSKKAGSILGDNWQLQLLGTHYTLDAFKDKVNIAARNGRIVGEDGTMLTNNFIDADLDTMEAVRAAPFYLPATGMIWGRKGKPRSHYGYRLPDGEDGKSASFNDPSQIKSRGNPDGQKAKMAELRYSGITIVPGSTNTQDGHEEQVRWEPDGDGEPGRTTYAELHRAMQHLCAAALVGRYWLEGVRQDMAGPLAGMLARGGMQQQDAEMFMRAVCAAARDEEVDKRLGFVRDTYTKMSAGVKEVTGRKELSKYLDRKVLGSVATWLQLQAGREKHPQGIRAHLATLLMEESSFAVDAAGRLHVYDRGVYRAEGADYVAKRVQELAREQGLAWLPDWNTGVARYIANESPRLWAEPPENVLNVANGLLNLGTWELSPHTPEHLTTIQLPVEYQPTATCPRWDSFIAQVFPEDAQAWGYRFPMWLIWTSRAVQKAALLFGPAGCGKSTYLEALIEFLGRLNVSTKTLHQLADDRFSKAALYGKLANIKTELPGRSLKELDTFAALVTHDTQDGERKFEQAFTFQPFAKLLFSANQAPPVTDSGALDAYADRWVVMPFPNRFRGTAGELDQGSIIAELTTPEELSGLLNRALAELPALREGRLHQRTWAPSMLEAYQKFMADTTKLSVWLSFAVEYTGDPDDRLVKQDLLDAHFRYATKHHQPVLTETRFFIELKHANREMAASVKYVYPNSATRKQVNCYVGWKLRSEYLANEQGGLY